MAKQKDSGIVPATASGLAPAPDYLGDNRDLGMEVPAGEIIVPMAMLVQKTSPLVDQQKAMPGQIIDTLSYRVLADPRGEPKSLTIVPLVHFMTWVEWAEIDSGGGVIDASNDPHGKLAMRSRALEKNRSGRLAVTGYHNVICAMPEIEDDGKPLVRLVRFFKSSYKAGKRLLTLIQARNRPMFSGLYDLGVVFKEKGSDRKWYEHTIDNSTVQGGWATKEQFELYAALHQKWKPVAETINPDRIVDTSDVAVDDAMGEPEKKDY